MPLFWQKQKWKLHKAIAKHSKVFICAHEIQIPSLWDSGSNITLLQQSYFDKYLLPKVNWQWLRRSMLTLYADLQLPMIGRCQYCTLSLILPFGT